MPESADLSTRCAASSYLCRLRPSLIMQRARDFRESHPGNRGLYTSDLSDAGSESSHKGSKLDNAATLRKLNAALIELDKLKAERNSYQMQYRSLQLDKERLEQELEENRVNDRAVNRQVTEIKALEEENRRVKQALALAETETKELASRLQTAETERLSFSRKFQSESQSLTQAQRSRESLVTQIDQLRDQLQQYEAANRELALSKAQVTRDLNRLEYDRKSLLEQLEQASRRQDQEAVAVVKAREERESIHQRHSRLLASVGIMERLKAAIRKKKTSGWVNIRDYVWTKSGKISAVLRLDKVLSRRLKRFARRRLRIWKDKCDRVRKEEEKISLLQGHELSLARQAKFAMWQALTYRSKVNTQTRTRRIRFQAVMERLEGILIAQEQGKLVAKAVLGWKSYHLKRKREKLTKAVESVTLQATNWKDGLTQEQVKHHHSLQRKALSCLFRQGKEQVWSYFLGWKNVMLAYRASLPVLKRVATIWNRSQETKALSTWKSNVSYSQLSDVVSESQQLANRNLHLSETIVDLTKNLQRNTDKQRINREKRLRMSVVLNWKLQIRAGLRLWARNALQDSCKVSAVFKLTDMVREYHLHWGLHCIKTKADKVKARLIRDVRKNTVVGIDTKLTLKRAFQELQEFFYTRKSAKSLLNRALIGTSIRCQRKGFLTWKSAFYAYKEADLSLEIHHLSLKNSDLTDNLASTQSELGHTKSVFAGFTLNVKTRASSLISKITLNLFLKLAEKKFNFWKNSTNLRKSQKSKMKRLILFWRKQNERKAMNSWTIHTKKSIKITHKKEVNSLQTEIRDQIKSYKILKDFSEEKIANQAGEIENLDGKLQKSKGSYEKLRGLFCNLQLKVVSLRKLSFDEWKNRVENVKKHVKLLGIIVRQRILKKSLFKVKIYAFDEARKMKNKRKIAVMLAKLAKFGLKTSTFIWKNQVNIIKEAELMAILAKEQNEKQQISKNNSFIKDKMSAEMLKRTNSEFIGKILKEWHLIARKLRKLSSISRVFHISKTINREKLTFLRLYRNCYISKVYYRKCQRCLHLMSGNTLQSTFSAWKNRVKDLNYLGKVVKNTYERHYKVLISTSFQAISSYFSLQKTEFTSKFELKRSLIRRAVVSMTKSSLATNFFLWKSRITRDNRKNKALNRVLRGIYRRFVGKYYGKWEEMRVLGKQREYLEKEGPVAKLNSHLETKVTALKELMTREGVDVKRFERFMLERETRGSALIMLTPPHHEDYLAAAQKYFLLWKMVAYKKQRILKTAKRMLVYRHKTDLFVAFKTWKTALPQISSLKQSYSKHELATMMSQLEKQVERLTLETQSMTEELQYRGNYCMLLEALARKGQNQSLSHLNAVVQRPMRQALYQWGSNVKAEAVMQLKTQVMDMRRELEYANGGFEEAKEENRVLVDENGELRKTTRDGIAFAEALEAAGEENRELREELRERSRVVERLMEENKSLADRIRRLRGEEDGYSSSQSMKYRSLNL